MSGKVELTLSVDANVVGAARRYAAAHDTSVSKLVEDFLTVVVQEPRASSTPVLDRLRGTLAGVSEHDWRDHVDRKHRR